MLDGQCPNCGSVLVDGVCVCRHDGNNPDCQCEYCQAEKTADLPPATLAKITAEDLDFGEPLEAGIPGH